MTTWDIEVKDMEGLDSFSRLSRLLNSPGSGMAILNDIFNLFTKEFASVMDSSITIRETGPQELQLRQGKSRQYTN